MFSISCHSRRIIQRETDRDFESPISRINWCVKFSGRQVFGMSSCLAVADLSGIPPAIRSTKTTDARCNKKMCKSHPKRQNCYRSVMVIRLYVAELLGNEG